jgi:hypothetical protein
MIVFLGLILVAALLLYSVVMAGALAPVAKASKRNGGTSSRRGAVRPDEVAARWATIEGMASSGGNGLRQAISEADKLFDHVMIGQGVRGETMGERLKSVRGRFGGGSTYDNLWRAHKVRNALAHEVGFDLVPRQAHEALASFKRGLQELGAL